MRHIPTGELPGLETDFDVYLERALRHMIQKNGCLCRIHTLSFVISLEPVVSIR